MCPRRRSSRWAPQAVGSPAGGLLWEWRADRDLVPFFGPNVKHLRFSGAGQRAAVVYSSLHAMGITTSSISRRRRAVTPLAVTSRRDQRKAVMRV